MELVSSSTRTCRGELLIFDSPLEEPTIAPVTVQVSKLDWELFEVICYGREKLVEDFRDAYGQTDSLLEILNRIERCVFTVAAYQHCPEVQKWASPSSLYAAADRLGKDITMKLPSLITDAEIKLAEKKYRLSIVPLRLIAYTNPISRYVLDSINYEMLLTDSLLRIAKNAN